MTVSCVGHPAIFFQIMERKTIAYRLSKLKRNHLFQCQPLTDEERDVLNAAIMELRKSEFKQNLHKK